MSQKQNEKNASTGSATKNHTVGDTLNDDKCQITD